MIKELAAIQQKLKAPKNQYNNFGKYKYRNQEDILEAVKPILGNLVLTVSDEMVVVGDRIYVKATAAITDGTQTIQNTAYAREPQSKKGMDESQITGAASSYARKYALNGLFLIDDTKDADSMKPEPKKPNKDIAPEQQEYLPTETDWQHLSNLMQAYQAADRKYIKDMWSSLNESQVHFLWANIQGIEGGDKKTTINNNLKEWIK